MPLIMNYRNRADYLNMVRNNRAQLDLATENERRYAEALRDQNQGIQSQITPIPFRNPKLFPTTKSELYALLLPKLTPHTLNSNEAITFLDQIGDEAYTLDDAFISFYPYIRNYNRLTASQLESIWLKFRREWLPKPFNEQMIDVVRKSQQTEGTRFTPKELFLNSGDSTPIRPGPGQPSRLDYLEMKGKELGKELDELVSLSRYDTAKNREAFFPTPQPQQRTPRTPEQNQILSEYKREQIGLTPEQKDIVVARSPDEFKEALARAEQNSGFDIDLLFKKLGLPLNHFTNPNQALFEYITINNNRSYTKEVLRAILKKRNIQLASNLTKPQIVAQVVREGITPADIEALFTTSSRRPDGTPLPPPPPLEDNPSTPSPGGMGIPMARSKYLDRQAQRALLYGAIQAGNDNRELKRAWDRL